MVLIHWNYPLPPAHSLCYTPLQATIIRILGVKLTATPTQQFDAIIVGAGPAGSSAALALAHAGLQVALIERGEYPGAKNVSGAALYAPNLLASLLPDYWEEPPIERYLTRRVVTFMSQEAAFPMDFRTNAYARPPYNGFTLLRPKFHLRLPTKPDSPLPLPIPSPLPI